MEPQKFAVLDLSEDFRIVVAGSERRLSHSIHNEIDRYWQHALATHPTLFNGTVFTADIVRSSLMVGHFTEFRRVLAQFRSPHLYQELKLRPASVSGILLCHDRNRDRGAAIDCILGLRNRKSIFQPSVWQLPPAGSLDAKAVTPTSEIDWRCQLRSELTEELGIPGEAVKVLPPIAAVEYPGIHSLEIGVPLLCEFSGKAIVQAHQTLGNSEYEELRIIKLNEATEAISQLGERLSPPAYIFLSRLLNGKLIHNLS